MPQQINLTPRAAKFKDIPLPPEVAADAVMRATAGHAMLKETPAARDIPHCSPNDIVPEELQNRLMALDDAMTRCYFEIGDIANSLILYAPQISQNKAVIVTEQDVFNAVGVYCHRSGRTVRYYAETAEFYSEKTRRDFDMLPFGVFVLARSYRDHWQEMLEFARDHPTLGEERLKDQFDVRVGGIDYQEHMRVYDENPGVSDLVHQTLMSSGVLPDNTSIFPPKRSANGLLLSRLSKLVDDLDALCAAVTNEERRYKVLLILDQVRDLIQEVKDDIVARDVL